MNDAEVFALAEMLHILSDNRVNYSHQRKLVLLTIRQYLDDSANYLAGMWVDKRISKDDYHELMGHYRSLWDIVSSIITEDFGEQILRRF